MTVDPLATDVPAGGLWFTTSDAFVGQFDELGFSPASPMSLIAFCFDSPTTLGTVTVPLVVLVAASVVVGDGPLETIMVTVEPLAALAPPGGLVLMTRPAWTVSDACVFVLTLNPAWPRALPALPASWPTTLGTVA